MTRSLAAYLDCRPTAERRRPQRFPADYDTVRDRAHHNDERPDGGNPEACGAPPPADPCGSTTTPAARLPMPHPSRRTFGQGQPGFPSSEFGDEQTACSDTGSRHRCQSAPGHRRHDDVRRCTGLSAAAEALEPPSSEPRWKLEGRHHRLATPRGRHHRRLAPVRQFDRRAAAAPGRGRNCARRWHPDALHPLPELGVPHQPDCSWPLGHAASLTQPETSGLQRAKRKSRPARGCQRDRQR